MATLIRNVSVTLPGLGTTWWGPAYGNAVDPPQAYAEQIQNASAWEGGVPPYPPPGGTAGGDIPDSPDDIGAASPAQVAAAVAALEAELAAVAKTGNYSDLTGTPVLGGLVGGAEPDDPSEDLIGGGTP